MKKYIYLLASVLIFIIAGCDNNQSATSAATKQQPKEEQKQVVQSQPKQEKETKTNAPTQTEVLKKIKQQLPSSLNPKLPKQLPIANNLHLSAATISSKTMYRIIFFESSTVIPINNKKLNNSANAHPIATLEVQTYSNEAEATSALNYMTPEQINTGNQSIDLGYGIKGYIDAGAGNVWLNWHEGRWYLSVHASNIEGEKPEPLAKKIVTFLEQNTLPIPHKYGIIQADSNAKKSEKNKVQWQEGRTVYSLYNVDDPIKMLTIATHFENTTN